MSTIFEHTPHPYIEQRKSSAPATVADQLPKNRASSRFNSWLAIKITSAVGTMWCAYLFAVIALISLPDAIKGGRATIISWIAQTFLQLVLLSIIIVGQNILSAASDKRSEATYNDADAILHEALQIQQHLEGQDRAIEQILASMKDLPVAAGPGGRTGPPEGPGEPGGTQ